MPFVTGLPSRQFTWQSLSKKGVTMNQNKLNRSIILACISCRCLNDIRPAWAQTAEPILRVEVGTHNAGIWDIAIDPSNRILVTGSEDKTVRVWDISGRGQQLRILRPPWASRRRGRSSPWPFPRTPRPWRVVVEPAR